VVIIAYHSSTTDPFYSSEAAVRKSNYSIPGYPTVVFQGRDLVVGGSHSQSQYYRYEPEVLTWSSISTPIVIAFDGAYNPATRTGTVTAHLMNTGSASVSGLLHFGLTENGIPYSWQGQTHLSHMMRDMIPDAYGESVTIPGRTTLDKTRTFTVDPGWNDANCKLIVFLQDAATTKEVYQAEKWIVRPAVSVTVTPDQSPVVIPSGGGTVGYTVDLVNNTSSSQTFDQWGIAVLPNGMTRRTLARSSITLPANGTRSTHYNANVPGNAPAGNYTQIVKIGHYDVDTWDRAYFPATKSAADESALSKQICPIE
jgi:hypothetical protein